MKQGSTLALIPSIGMTLFFGIGSIVKNNAQELPDQRLPLRTDGCYIDESATFFNSTQQYTMKQNAAWKDETYSPLTTILSISYLWPPLVTIVSTVVFGLLFSFVINLFKRPPKVKTTYMTPIVLSMWISILGRDRLRFWLDFDDEDGNSENNPDSRRNSIPVTLSVSLKSTYDILCKKV